MAYVTWRAPASSRHLVWQVMTSVLAALHGEQVVVYSLRPQRALEIAMNFVPIDQCKHLDCGERWVLMRSGGKVSFKGMT